MEPAPRIPSTRRVARGDHAPGAPISAKNRSPISEHGGVARRWTRRYFRPRRTRGEADLHSPSPRTFFLSVSQNDDLKNFRQWDSVTPGHPENFITNGIEVTTGPLGMGICNAVGLALAEKHLAGRFNKPDCEIVDHYTYAIMGDGCNMEGMSGEGASLAAHWELGKLIAFYDDNHISIDGHTDISFTEDVCARYEAYGWHVQHVEDGNTDLDAIRKAIEAAKKDPAPRSSR